MGNAESVRPEFEAEVVTVEDVPAEGMRLLYWPSTGELQYGCEVESGWALSGRLAVRALLDARNRDARAELLPVLETIVDGDDFGHFEGDLVGGLLGCEDVTELAGGLLAALGAVVDKPRTPTRRRASKATR